MKKQYLFSIILVLVLVLITACSSSENSSSKSSAGGDTKDASLDFWVYEPESIEGKNKLKDLAKKYEEETGTEIKLTFIPKDDFNTKLNGTIAVGNNPDISYLDQPLVPQFAKDGVLLNVDQYVEGENGINRDDYFDGAFNSVIVDEKLYGLPLNQSTVVLFYNKDLVEDPPETFEEWIDMAKEVYQKGEIAAFEGIGDGGYAAWLYPALVHSAGGSMVNDDETKATFGEGKALEAAKLLDELLKYSDQSVRDTQNAFGNGLIATKISGAWDIDNYKNNFSDLDFGVSLIPYKEGEKSHSNLGGDDIVIYENTEYPDASWDFIKYLTNDENAITMSEITGNFPVNVNAAADSRYKEDENLSVFSKQIETAVARPRITEWLKINDEVVGSSLDKVIISGEDPVKVMKKAQEDANVIMSK
ncbi:sugar ABC transporter substrate-binding protein [Pseudalkalibacillus hwajinpoensis]|uniref:sugar ABC transporter substrate-binding protein n=1 Tax=Guptibacillus hwajinpoensis TaxID=208199 RepID=UPI001CD7F46C|nr:ABC transporter substrate-binding protein [Pseudalkalibacillus hwajinpoensis]MCA0991268.1 ABC transporter substrate-binding protein [Pseudalkalibacillus hwajinpoensis]